MRHREHRTNTPAIYKDVCGWCSDKKGIFLSVYPIKEKNLQLGPQRAGEWPIQYKWNFCHGCLKLYEYLKIHTYRVNISLNWRVEKDVDLR